MSASRYDPTMYDLMTSASQGGDVAWYLRLAQQGGGRVLELGAGTGRVVVPMAEAGIETDALEYDAGMREALKRRVNTLPEETQSRIRVIAGDMRQFTLDRRYTQIQIPFRAFLHNLTREDQLACLGCCRIHLTEGGRLAFNVFHPSLEVMSRNHSLLRGVWRWMTEREQPDGGVIVHSEANRYDSVLQRVSSRHRYERFDEQGHLVDVFYQRLELAYLYPGDVRDLLREAGFTEITLYGGFDERPFSTDGQELVVVARA